MSSASGIDLKQATTEISRISSLDSEISSKDIYLIMDIMETDFTGIPLLAGALLELHIHESGVREILLKEFNGNRKMASRSAIAGLLMQTGRVVAAENYLASLLLSKERGERMLGIIGFGLAGSAGFSLRNQFGQVLEKADQFDANQCFYVFKFLGRIGSRYEPQLCDATNLAIREGKFDVAGLFISSFSNFPERSPATLEMLKQVPLSKAFPEELRFSAVRSLAYSSKKHSQEVVLTLEKIQFVSRILEEDRMALLNKTLRHGTLQTSFDLLGLLGDM